MGMEEAANGIVGRGTSYPRPVRYSTAVGAFPSSGKEVRYNKHAQHGEACSWSEVGVQRSTGAHRYDRMIQLGAALFLCGVYVVGASWRDRMSDYKEHPCIRKCIAGDIMTCEYTFTLEDYFTLTKACYDCPFNQTDCFRPHCVPGDGVARGILTVNRMLPGPPIHVCEGDTIVVNVRNMMEGGGQGTSIHWHGVLQEEAPHMDGVSMVTQCPIPVHSTFQYRFRAVNPGTHFWHSHQGLQRVDGLFGALVVRQIQSRETHHDMYDLDLPEHTITVQDWLDDISTSKFDEHQHAMGSHTPNSILINGYGSAHPVSKKSQSHGMHMMTGMHHHMGKRHTDDAPYNTLVDTVQNTSSHNAHGDHTVSGNMDHSDHRSSVKKDLPDCECGEETSQDTALTPRALFHVMAGFKYRFRLISNGVLNCPIEISVDNHTLIVVASDGKPFHPIEVDSFNIFSGERYDFVLSANQNVGNYWFRARGLGDCGANSGQISENAIIRYTGAPEENPSLMDYYHSGSKTGKKLNPSSRENTKETVPVTRLVAIPQSEEPLRFQQTKVFYLGLDFELTENVRFHDPDLYSISAMRHRGHHGHHLMTPQINRITCKMPHSPPLTQYADISEDLFCNEETVGKNCSREFCQCVHTLRVSVGDLVELVLVDEGKEVMDNHPMHLHGHTFAVVAMEKLGESTTVDYVKNLDKAGKIQRNLMDPVIKDTVTVPDGGYTIVRFTARNPGFWLFHCHLAFHMEMGMGLILQVGEPGDMVSPPQDFPRCGDWRDHSADKPIPPTDSAVIVEQTQLALLVFSLYILLI
ncbi:hypothetical protein ScPMuIL_001204 [Solemya velum]